MKIPIAHPLRQAFTSPDPIVVAHIDTGEVQIIPRQAYDDHRTRGWIRILACEGCGLYAYPETVFSRDNQMMQPVPEHLAREIYGRSNLVYLLCPPRHPGTHACRDLAELNDELHLRIHHLRPELPDADDPPCD